MYQSTEYLISYGQEYSCIDNELTVYGQLEITGTNRPEHELKMLLNRFLFTPSTWGREV